MKNKIKKYAGRSVWLVIMILAYVLSMAAGKTYPVEESALMLYKKSNFMTGSEAVRLRVENAQRKQPFHFTLWGEKKNQKIRVQEYDRSKRADVLIINGSSKLLFPQDPILAEEDQYACLLSEDLAYQLFGSKEVTGLIVRYQNQDYQVNGVIRNAKQTMVIQSTQQTKAVLFAAALDVPKGEVRKTAVADFKQFIGAAQTTMDLNVVARAGQFAVVMMPLGMLLVMVYMAVKQAISLSDVPFKCLAFTIGAVIFIAAFIYLVDWGEGLYFPFSPSRWSDFQYWGKIAKELQDGVRDFLLVEKRAPESIIINYVLSAAGYAILSIIIFCWKVKNIVPETGKEVLYYSLLHILAASLAVIVAKGSAQIALDTGLWMFMPLYMAGRYALFLLKKSKW